MQDSDTSTRPQRGGLSRREAIKKGAIATGLVWAAPAVTTYGSRAMAQSPGTTCVAQFTFTTSGGAVRTCEAVGPTGISGGFGQCAPITGSPCVADETTATCLAGQGANTAFSVIVEAPSGCIITEARGVQNNQQCVNGTPLGGNQVAFGGLDIVRVRVRVQC